MPTNLHPLLFFRDMFASCSNSGISRSAACGVSYLLVIICFFLGGQNKHYHKK